MYDKIDLYISNPDIIGIVETAIKSSPAYVQVGNFYEWKFSLMNGKTHANAHGLTVQITEKTKGDKIAPPMLHISGSLRKWFHGALSMADLTRHDTWVVLHRLADELGIPYDEFREVPISAIEVGLNLDIGKLHCEDIKNCICSFKDGRYKCTDIEGYKSFKTNKASAKVYNKVNEICESVKKRADKLGTERFENTYRKKNILRTEFKVYRGANSVHGYFGIRTVGDMVDRYNWVALKWLQLALKFGFKGTELLPLTLKKKSAKEVTDYIKYRGVLDIGETELEAILARLPAQARKDVRNAVKLIREKMPETVNIKARFRQIAKGQFVQQFNRSYRQYSDAMGELQCPTLL